MAEQFAIAEGTDKLLRSHLKHFIDASFGGETPIGLRSAGITVS